MNLREEALGILKKDKVRNINLINFMKGYLVSNIFIEGNSVLIKGKSDENWIYISSKSEVEFKKLLEKLTDEDEYFVIMEDWMLPYILKGKRLDWKLTCMKFTLNEAIEMSENKYTYKDLDIRDANYIYENSKYKQYTSAEYIEERIKKGVSLGFWEEDKLVAWIMTQDDGAIGFLNVLQEYRYKGYGYNISLAMIKKVRDFGEIPFEHIEEDNIKSIGLALKLGFKKERRVSWVKVCKKATTNP